MAACEFDRLPTELIMSIFDKISDVRSLCSCYSVSKQFAALVLQTRSVSMQIGYASFAQSSRDLVWPHGILNFLKKLSCFERATIQISPNPSSSDSEYSNLFRWKSDSCGFILVSAEKEATGGGFPLYEQHSAALFARMGYRLFDSMSFVVYMEALVDFFPNLKDVSAVDSTGRGRVVLDLDSKMRKDKDGKTMFSVRRWSTACLPLLSGGECVMKEVTVLTVREMKHRYAPVLEENPFQEREYCEVAKTMMKDYVCSEVLVSAPIQTPFPRVAWDALLYERNQRISGNRVFTGYSYRRDRLSPHLETVLTGCCDYAQSKFV